MANAADADTTTIVQAPTAARRLRWPNFVLWLAAALATGLLLAWLAVAVQAKFSPLLLFPAMSGAVLGATLAALLRVTNVANRRAVTLGTLLAVAVLVVGQHSFSYRAAIQAAMARREAIASHSRLQHPQDHAQLASLFDVDKPPSFAQFLGASADRGTTLFGREIRGGWMDLLWGVDAGLVLLATVLIVAIAVCHPYCDRCGSWYRTTRSGGLSAAAAVRVAGAAGLAGAPSRAARYRLVTCRGGCVPSGLSLIWSSGPPSQAWLDATARQRVAAALDEALDNH